MKRSNTGKLALIVCAAFIIMAGMTYMLFTKIVQIKAVTAQIATAGSALEAEKKTLEQLEMLDEQDSAILEYVSYCARMMPDTPDESTLINYIQGISNKVLTNLVRINFEPRVPAEKFTAMPMNIAFEGKYTDFINFLDELRNGDRAIRIDGVYASLTENSDMTVKVEISAKAFYLTTRDKQ